jgi:hypothetical protein
MNLPEINLMEKRWYRIRFSQKEILSNKEAQLKREFEMLYRRSSSPDGMALLLSQEKSMDKGVIYYISLPKSFALELSVTMSNYSITTSGEPAGHDLVLVAGEQS